MTVSLLLHGIRVLRSSYKVGMATFYTSNAQIQVKEETIQK